MTDRCGAGRFDDGDDPKDPHDDWLEDTMHLYREMDMYRLSQPTRSLTATAEWLVAGGCATRGTNEVTVMRLPWADGEADAVPDLHIMFGGLTAQPVTDLACLGAAADHTPRLAVLQDRELALWASRDGGDLLAPAHALSLPEPGTRLLADPAAYGPWLACLTDTRACLLDASLHAVNIELPWAAAVPASRLVAAAWTPESTLLLLGSAGDLLCCDPRDQSLRASGALSASSLRKTGWRDIAAHPSAPACVYMLADDGAVGLADPRHLREFVHMSPALPPAPPRAEPPAAPPLSHLPGAAFVRGNPFNPRQVLVGGGAWSDVYTVELGDGAAGASFAHTAHSVVHAHVLAGMWHPTRPGLALSADCAAGMHAWAVDR